VLVYRDDAGRYRLTTLGLHATRGMLPLDIASGAAQLLRDLLSLDDADRLLAAWRPLDHLIMLELLSERAPRLLPFSERLADAVDSWMEGHPRDVPVLYREWLRGQPGGCRTSEVLGSLGVSAPASKDRDAAARQAGYLALFHSIVLFELGQGHSVVEVERRWSVSDLEGIEERWRDDLLWLVGAFGRTLDVRAFYFHLRETCTADDQRVKRVKRLLAVLLRQTYELQGMLKYCSPLGPVLVAMRAARGHRATVKPPGNRQRPASTVGVQTIRRLEAAGVRDLAALSTLHVDDLIALGVRPGYARQLHAYVRRRLQ
jgi:helicase